MESDKNNKKVKKSKKSNKKKKVPNVYIPSKKNLSTNELEMDKSSYVMHHHAYAGASCLSFDIIEDCCGDNRNSFPMEAFLTAGTQSEFSHTNSVVVMRAYNLHPLKSRESNEDDDDDNDDSSSEDSDSENNEQKPELNSVLIRHQGSVNRIRNTVIDRKHFAATWSESAKVHIWELDSALNALGDFHLMANFNHNDENMMPLFTFTGHRSEGFAVDWSPIVKGCLATGDSLKNIHIWELQDNCTWTVSKQPYVGHTKSVEDIQWSPNEATVFASCSMDKTIRVWDCRSDPQRACMLTVSAHDSDVNVISWNRNEPFLVSGGDEGILKIWDLRQFSEGTPVGVFRHHFDSITSVEWHPHDSTVFAASGADEQVTLWDLSVECDDASADTVDIPPQLLFIHQGQKDIKELHWHKQLPGVVITTALDGFNFFKTISV